MSLYHVVAVANQQVIGKDNKLPWHFSCDLKFFKQLTMGSTVIMGRKTYESIGKPLPGRENFVLSRTRPSPQPSPSGRGPGEGGVVIFSSLDEALESVHAEKGFIIGGAKVFEQSMDRVAGIYLTRIHADYEGDTFYPEVSKSFTEKSRKILQEENPKIEVIYYERS